MPTPASMPTGPPAAKSFHPHHYRAVLLRKPRSGIGDTSFHPWVWYRRYRHAFPATGKAGAFCCTSARSITAPWSGSTAASSGSHEGGNVPFSFDITPLLKAGANTVTVRAEDPPTDRSIPRGKQYWEPKSRGIFYTRTSGIWQTVWMEPVAETHLERVRITPSLDGAVRFEARIARPQPDWNSTPPCASGRDVVAGAMARAAGSPAARSRSPSTIRGCGRRNRRSCTMSTFELRRGATVIDRVNSYFGFRTVATENGRIVLNGRPIYLKTVLDQGYWPECILTPPSDEAIQYDIRMTKQMGFNGARKHQKIEDPRFLYWADKMGFLVSAEMANAQLFNEDYVARFTREWLEAVARDYNHPSIIVWAPINESWGVPNLRDPRQQIPSEGALHADPRSLDATRLVIDNEGWEHTDMTDLFAIHDYARTGDLLFEKYKDLGKPGVPAAAGQPRGRDSRLSTTTARRSIFRNSAASLTSRRASRCRRKRGATRASRRRRKAPWSACAASTRRSRSCLHRDLLHADHRRGAGDQRPDDLRPQAEVRHARCSRRSMMAFAEWPVLLVIRCGACRELMAGNYMRGPGRPPGGALTMLCALARQASSVHRSGAARAPSGDGAYLRRRAQRIHAGLLDLLADTTPLPLFFSVGECARLPEIAREVVRGGHEIGNHS